MYLQTMRRILKCYIFCLLSLIFRIFENNKRFYTVLSVQKNVHLREDCLQGHVVRRKNMKLIFLIFESIRPNWVAVCKNKIHSHSQSYVRITAFYHVWQESAAMYLILCKNVCIWSLPPKKGSVVKDILILSGPCTKSKPQCLQCFNKLSTSTRVDCRSCGYPFCSIKCTKATEHTVECSIFR